MIRSLPVVNTLIAAPCDVPWDSMHGDATKRHCGECKRDVHNLSAMTHAEMRAFLDAATPDETGHLPCISLFQRTDGTVLTADCPVGLGARRRRALLTSTLSIGAVALVAVTALATLWLDHERKVAFDSFDDRPAVFETKKSTPFQYVPSLFGTKSDRAPEGVMMAGAPVVRVAPLPPQPSVTGIPPAVPVPNIRAEHMQLKGKMQARPSPHPERGHRKNEAEIDAADVFK